jgi:hypothetical protein
MEVVDFDMKYYPYIYKILDESGIDTKKVLILDTFVLLNNNLPIGFYTAGKVEDMYIIAHFYIEPSYRGFEAIYKLVPHLVKRAILLCKYLCFHIIVGTDAEEFFHSYFRKYKKEKLNSPYNNIEFYKVEV